ncbi:MAG: type II toxin-antitoxin system PemK/MazF family toxin [Candidatus Baltobacteraceae bacterium]
MSSEYVPDIGHIIWIDFDPQAPALILSPTSYNAKTSLAVMCAITSNVKGYPFEVLIEGVPKIHGTVPADHVKSLDWRVRNARFKAVVAPILLEQVRLRPGALLGF